MKLKLTTLSLTFMLSMGLSMTSGHAYSVDPNLSDAQLEKVVKQAEYYVREFEKEVEQQRGGDKAIYRSKKDALDRVQILKQTYPDDPGVEKLFQRTKTALMKSKGDYTEVDPSWTKYKTDEANLRKTIAAKGEQEWNRILSSAASPDKIITKEFPIPDPKKISIEELKDSYVVLKDVEYPANQFYGGSGEYIWHGKPSAGYYFVQLDGRNWVGPYEAVKRYRRLVDSSPPEKTRPADLKWAGWWSRLQFRFRAMWWLYMMPMLKAPASSSARMKWLKSRTAGIPLRVFRRMSPRIN